MRPGCARLLNAHRVTLQGGFVVIYTKNQNVLTAFDAPPRRHAGEPGSMAAR